MPIDVPPLRERPTTCRCLVEHFLAAAAERLGRPPCELAADALDLLCHYHWPGNVRELENLVTRASVLGQRPRVAADDLRLWLHRSDRHCRAGGQRCGESHDAITAGMKLEDMERRLIEATLEHFDGHRAKAAQALGIGIRTLTNKLRLYGYAPRARTFGKGSLTEQELDDRSQNRPAIGKNCRSRSATFCRSSADCGSRPPIARRIADCPVCPIPAPALFTAIGRGLARDRCAARSLSGTRLAIAALARRRRIELMLPDLFGSTTIPVLGEVLNFAQARHTRAGGQHRQRQHARLPHCATCRRPRFRSS